MDIRENIVVSMMIEREKIPRVIKIYNPDPKSSPLC